MSKRRIALFGGTGFVGTELASRLAAQVDEVVILTRRRVRVDQVRVVPNITTRQVDTHNDAAVNDALAGIDAVVNLVGILNESGSASFATAHDQFTQRVLRAVAHNAVPRYLHMSALGADAENGSSQYLKSKGRAEAHVHAAPDSIAWTIFRPSVIFGRNDSFFNRFAGLLQLAPIFPLACPDARMAPVYVGDVCDSMVTALDDPATVGETLELCGPDILTLREIVEYTARTRGIRRMIIGLPDAASRLQAKVLGLVPGKPFSMDNYLSLQTDSVCSDACSPQPTPIEAVVPRYIGHEDYNGRLQHSRERARR